MFLEVPTDSFIANCDIRATFNLTPTNQEKNEDIIKILNIRKSIGPNCIPTKLLKQFSEKICLPLEKLINLPFEKGVFPNALKLANITAM